jgi:hypothetical protein
VKHIRTYKFFQKDSGLYTDLSDIVSKYQTLQGDRVEVGVIDGVKIVAVDKEKLGVNYKEWRKYIGSHHWGKKTSYIPEDEIWIAQDLKPKKFVRLIHHELIERELMRKLVEQGMTTLEAWKTAHHMVKSMGY